MTKHSALWLAKHASKTQEKQEKATVVVKQEKAEVLPAPKPRTVGQELKETVQLKANLTMTEARELAQKVEMLKLDLRKVGPHGSFKKDGRAQKQDEEEIDSGGAEEQAQVGPLSGGAIVVDESQKLSEESQKLREELGLGSSAKKPATKSGSGSKASKASTTKAKQDSTKSSSSKPTSKLRKAGVVPSPQPSPQPAAKVEKATEKVETPVATPAADPEPDATGANAAGTNAAGTNAAGSDPTGANAAGADMDVDAAAPDAEGCHSLSASLASDDWCMSNCALGNCPLTMCSTDCSSLKSGKSSGSAAAAATTKELVTEGGAASDDGLEACRSIGDGPVDDGWCVSNCALGNCPETKCSEGCLRPGKGGASKKPAQNSASAPVESPAPSTLRRPRRTTSSSRMRRSRRSTWWTSPCRAA